MDKYIKVVFTILVLSMSSFLVSPMEAHNSGENMKILQLKTNEIKGHSQLSISITTSSVLDTGSNIFFTVSSKRKDTGELVKLDSLKVELYTKDGLLLSSKTMDSLHEAYKFYYGSFKPVGAKGNYKLKAIGKWDAPWGEKVKGKDITSFGMEQYYNITGKLNLWKNQLTSRLEGSVNVFNNTTSITNNLNNLQQTLSRISSQYSLLWDNGRRSLPDTWNITVLNISSVPSSTGYTPSDGQVQDAITMLNSMGINTVRNDITSMSGFKSLVSTEQGDSNEYNLFVVSCHGKYLPTSSGLTPVQTERWFKNVSAATGTKNWRWLLFDKPFSQAGYDNGTSYVLGMEGWNLFLKYSGIRFNPESYNYTVETVSSVPTKISQWIEDLGETSLPSKFSSVTSFSFPESLVSSSVFTRQTVSLIEGSSEASVVIGTPSDVVSSIKAALGILGWRWSDVAERLKKGLSSIIEGTFANSTIKQWFEELYTNITSGSINFDLGKINETIQSLLGRSSSSINTQMNMSIRRLLSSQLPGFGSFSGFLGDMQQASSQYGNENHPSDSVNRMIEHGFGSARRHVISSAEYYMGRSQHYAVSTSRQVERGNQKKAEDSASKMNRSLNRLKYYTHPTGSILGAIKKTVGTAITAAKVAGKAVGTAVKAQIAVDKYIARETAKTFKTAFFGYDENLTATVDKYNLNDTFIGKTLKQAAKYANKAAHKVDDLLEKKSGAIPTGLFELTVYETFRFGLELILKLGIRIQEFINKLRDFLESFWNKIKDFYENLKNVFKNVWDKIQTWAADVVSQVNSWLTKFVGNLSTVFSQSLSWIKNTTSSLYNKMKGKLVKAKNVIQNSFNYMKQGFTSYAQASGSFMISELTDLMSFSLQKVNERLDGLYRIMGNVIEAMKDITGVVRSVTKFMSEALQNVKDAIIKAIRITVDFLGKKLDSLLSGTSNITDKLANASDTVNKIGGFLPEFMKPLINFLKAKTARAKQIYYALKNRVEKGEPLPEDLFFAIGNLTTSTSSLHNTVNGRYTLFLGKTQEKMYFMTTDSNSLVEEDTLKVDVKTPSGTVSSKQAEKVETGIYKVATGALSPKKYVVTAKAQGSPTSYLSDVLSIPRKIKGGDIAGYASLSSVGQISTGGDLPYGLKIVNKKYASSEVVVTVTAQRKSSVVGRMTKTTKVPSLETLSVRDSLAVNILTSPGGYDLVAKIREPNGDVTIVKSLVYVSRGMLAYSLYMAIIAVAFIIIALSYSVWKKGKALDELKAAL